VLVALPCLPLAKHGANQHSEEGGDIITSTEARGTSQSYLLRRLQRDRPELVEQIGKGKRAAQQGNLQ